MSKLPTPKPGIMDVPPYLAGKSKSAGAKRIIKLSSNESPLGPSAKAVSAYQGKAETLHRYPDAHYLELREAIAKVHNISAENIVCGAGSDELIMLLLHAYAGAGDEVVYTQHSFLMYEIYTKSFSAKPVVVPAKNLGADVDALLAAITERTKIVFLTNPNNPTGTYNTKQEVKRLRDGLPSHILLVVDAAYAEYAEDVPDYSSGQELVESSESTVMLRTFSKIYGLPALRLGWGYAPAHVVDVINRIRGPFNINAPAIAAGIAAMGDQAHVKASVAHNTQWRAWLTQQCEAMGLSVVPSLGNFILVKFANAAAASAMNAHLMEAGIIVREVANYDLPEYLRITIGTDEEMHALVQAMKAL